jgi:hypothetical protein
MKPPPIVPTHLAVLAALGLASVLAGCGGGGGGTGGSGTTTLTSDAQTPPEGVTAVKAWLAAGSYKSWHCEPAPHPSRAPSPHNANRICSNDKLSSASGPPFPQGAAGVKELYTMPDGGAGDGGTAGESIRGYAVYLKTAADSAGGANWYWYEDDPLVNPPSMVIADGLGTSGNPKTICVGCHTAAGSDAMHVGPGDFVYTQVK